MPRDDFSAKVIERLRARVAHRCSNPDCRVPTIGPGTDPMAVANIGKAAHIVAASPGGPRYRTSMTSAERSSIDNAIWLCSNCATRIDVAPDSYSIELLHDWKRSAERAADTEKGKPLPREDDARNQLVAAFGGVPVPFVAKAIHNIHGAVEQSLQSLDPRFRVETSFRNNTTTYGIHARETVTCTIHVPAATADQWQEALQNLIDHGQAEFPAEGIQLKGSPLLERLSSELGDKDAQFRMEAQKKPALQKLKLIDPATNMVEQFDDITGEVSFGRKTLTFEGHTCGGMLNVSLKTPWTEKTSEVAVTIPIQLDKWSDCDVRFLPYFEKLSRLYQRLADGWAIELEMEIEGLHVIRFREALPSKSEAFRSLNGLLRYVALVRKIANYVGQEIRFSHNVVISEDEFRRAAELVEIIEGKASYDRSAIISNPSCTLVSQENASNIQYLMEAESPCFLLMQRDEGEEFSAFGQTINMPRLELQLQGVKPILSISDPSTVKDGDAVEVVWEPTDSFRYSLRYITEDTESVA